MKSGKCHHVLGQGASRFELDLAAYPVTELIDRHQLVLLRTNTLNIGWFLRILMPTSRKDVCYHKFLIVG